MEIEVSSTEIDLRFIPNDVEFPYKCKDFADSVPDSYSSGKFYKYFVKAKQMCKVDLSWDQTPVERQRAIREVWNSLDNQGDLDVHSILASDQDS